MSAEPETVDLDIEVEQRPDGFYYRMAEDETQDWDGPFASRESAVAAAMETIELSLADMARQALGF